MCCSCDRWYVRGRRVGPFASAQHLTSDYAGGGPNGGGYGGCWPDSSDKCIITITQAIAERNVGGVTQASAWPGAHSHSLVNRSISAALAVAKAADTVILALGEINTEGEGHDRPDIVLDQAQLSLASGVFALGKPTVLLLSNGCSIALDGLIGGSHAIVETFDPVRPRAIRLPYSTHIRFASF